MGANAHTHEDLRLDGTGLIARIVGRQFRGFSLRLGIGQLTLNLAQGRNLLGRSSDDPNGLAAPLDRDFFTRLHA